MITINLTNASNGIIKKITDTKYNGVDQTAEFTYVYELNEEDKEDYFDQIINFYGDLSKDLGFDIGSDYEKEQIIFDVDWGENYIPSIEELDERIKFVSEELRQLKASRKMFISNVE